MYCTCKLIDMCWLKHTTFRPNKVKVEFLVYGGLTKLMRQ